MSMPGTRPVTDVNHRPETYWWKAPQGKCHGPVFSTVEFLDSIQSSRRDLMLDNLQMYSSRMASSMNAGNFSESAEAGSRIRLNVVKSAIDTAVAHMATEKSRPMYLTKGGNYEARQKAKGLTKYMLGQYMYMQRYPRFLQIFRDAAIFGIGVEKFYEDPLYPGRITSERIMPDDLIFDVEETTSAPPRSIFQHREIARELLENNPHFRKHRKAIMQAGRVRTTSAHPQGTIEPVSVIEAWHLPSGKGAKDGRHVITINNATLWDQQYDYENFPLAILHWSDPLFGFMGIGAAEELTSIQLEINYIAQKIQKLMTLATSIVWKERGGGVSKILNQDWGQYEYSGKPPIFQNVAAVSAEYFHHLDRLYQRAFEIVGISQLAAQSKKPAGIESGEGLRVLNDIGAKRFLHIQQRCEYFHTYDASGRIFDVSNAMSKAGRNPTILAPGRDGIEEIDFKSNFLEQNKFLIQPYPAALLPEEPSGQIEKLKELSQAFPEMRPYLPAAIENAPDMEYIVKRVSAPVKVAEKMIDNILSGKEYAAPFAGMDLQIARQFGTLALNEAYVDDTINQDKVIVLQRWLGQVDQLIQETQAQDVMGNAMPQPGQVAPQAPGAQPTISGPPAPGQPPGPPQM